MTLPSYDVRHAIELDSLRHDRLFDASQLTSVKIARNEVLGLLAVAAHELHDPDSALLVRLAGLAGVDMRALDAPGG